MKLIIQIPCYNEEETLPIALANLPTRIEGIDEIETLVINDGSADRTVEIAKAHRVNHIVNFRCNKGLAYAWAAGLDASLRAGADIIVNTDGDNQYCGADIEKLVRPILDGEAEMVIGARPIESIEHFSWIKKRLQRLGSWVVSKCAGFPVDDAVSGFRAYSAEAARGLNLVTEYSHCTETLIRAAKRGIKVKSVPIRVNEELRESRLISSLPNYLWRQGRDIFRILTMIHPLKVFCLPALLFLMVGTAGCVRFLYFYFTGRGGGHIQSLIFSTIFIVVAFVLIVAGLAADLISSNQQLIEDVLGRIKRLEEQSEQNAASQASVERMADDAEERHLAGFDRRV